MKIIPFFLYGTARPGGGLHWMIEDIAEEEEYALAPNTELMIYAKSPTYPYLVTRPPARKKETVGTLALLRACKELEEFIRMELAVGYQMEAIRVDHRVPGLGPFALAFVWNHGDHDLQSLGSKSWLLRDSKFR